MEGREPRNAPDGGARRVVVGVASRCRAVEGAEVQHAPPLSNVAMLLLMIVKASLKLTTAAPWSVVL
jgi:hypothetical protein